MEATARSSYSDADLKALALLVLSECQGRQLSLSPSITDGESSAKTKPRDWILPGFSARESTMFFTSFYGFMSVGPVLALIRLLLPSFGPLCLTLFTFTYVFTLSEIASVIIHPGAFLVVVPVTTWIAGIHDIRLTSSPVLNGLLSMLLMGLIVPIIGGIPTHFVQLGVIFVLRKTFTLPSIYDFHLCSVFSVFVFLFILIAGLFDLDAAFAQTTISLYLTTVFVSGVFGFGGEEEGDHPLLKYLRLGGVYVSGLIVWAMINTFFYFTVGVRVYSSLQGWMDDIFKAFTLSQF